MSTSISNMQGNSIRSMQEKSRMVVNFNRSCERGSWPPHMPLHGLELLYLGECINSAGRKNKWADITFDIKMKTKTKAG